MANQSGGRSAAAVSRRRVAGGVLEITLLVTRLVTPEVRRLRPKQLSLSHMRALGVLDANPDADLSAIADYVGPTLPRDRKSTRLNSSHSQISYALFCLKKKKL